jgi:predicted transcriptional regulator
VEPEPGYDAWLAEEIERGRADIAAGRVLTLEELIAHTRQKPPEGF